jgi:hypothetical protein
LKYQTHRKKAARLKHKTTITFATRTALQIVEETISKIEMDVAGIIMVGAAMILTTVGLKFVMNMVDHCVCEDRQHHREDHFAAVMSTILMVVEINTMAGIVEEVARVLRTPTETIRDIENEAQVLGGIGCKTPISQFHDVNGTGFPMFRSS